MTDLETDTAKDDERPRLVRVDELRGPEAVSTCLRPLGLCELGGACDACWYSPDHPRFAWKGAANRGRP